MLLESEITGYDVLAVVCMGLWSYFISFHLVALGYGKYILYRKSQSEPEELADVPGVSILKPLVGGDANLSHNLASYFELTYSRYELFFCIQNPEDPAIEIVNLLIKQYPNVKARLFIETVDTCLNPKINNLLPGYAAAQYDLLWITDSNIKVTPNTLTDMVARMTENVGMVHQLPYTTHIDSLAGYLDKIHFGGAHGRVYLTTNACGVNCASGMSCLFRKHLLDEVGGLETFGCYIAEDFFLAKSIYDRGWKFALGNEPCFQNPGKRSVQNYVARMIRWSRLRMAMIPLISAFEPISECIVCGLIGAYGINHFAKIGFGTIYGIHIGCWFLFDMMLLKLIQPTPIEVSWKIPLMWIFRECISIWIYIRALSSRTVIWKNQKYRVLYGGKAEPYVK
ncbi:Ceramide glucosyltransferase [Trichoplax sp. H2]|uniref:ceramide glucosyltransferase n=1 Tax=Trichoplax adhaerens TaxID=10228 RepID=B3S3V6_TRIAD|nr:hypothetical protein TRIADDRAFT_58861 [Trichoplax adhaerens]EDV22351.1 hypothetical protein TRIADDRAFT_58861 [Trichoplax adhaerens]RDD38543.1 Ceramide glucosyltransferase [Trichoplax sp. H2]|eukprot:XP_002114895.1 hypothetical protein TRIADDRAFT_58861 [Trichoplax adhaerens]